MCSKGLAQNGKGLGRINILGSSLNGDKIYLQKKKKKRNCHMFNPRTNWVALLQNHSLHNTF